MNYIVALTLSRKIILLQFLSDRGVKFFENFSYGNFFPSPILSYTITKKPKKNFCGEKAMEGTKTPDGPQ